MRKLTTATLIFALLSSISAACDHCGNSSCDGAGHDDTGLLDRAAGLLHKMKKSKSKKGCSSLPGCGCEVQTPNCGCEAQAPCEYQPASPPACGCEIAPSCGCESGGCSGGCSSGGLSGQICSPTGAWDTAPGASCEPLLTRLFKFKKKKHGCSSCDNSCDVQVSMCDTGCTTPEPSCGCEPTYTAEPSCGCAVEPTCEAPAAPSCGCEATSSCTCSAAPTCGAEDGLFSRLFAHKAKPSCGCEAQSGCGCEIAEPECGCEASPSTACSCPACQQNQYVAPAPPVTYEPTPMVSPHANMVPPAPSEPIQSPSIVEPLSPVPAPAPPTNAQPLPDVEVDPFQDDAINIRRLPATTIQYRKQQKSAYGESYDPQANSGIRIRFSDESKRQNPVQFSSGIRDDSQQQNRYQETNSGVVPASGYNHHGLRQVPRNEALRNRYNEAIRNPLR